MPRLSGIKWETVRNRYSKRMMQTMTELYNELVESSPDCKPSEPWAMDADDYWVVITCEPEGKEAFDITLRLDDSNEYEGEPGGYTFSFSLVAYGGRILGGLSPYNYTPKVWCTTFKDIAERFQILDDNVLEIAYHVEKLLVDGSLKKKETA